MISASRIGLLLIAIGGCASPGAQEDSYKGGTVRTSTENDRIEPGPGAEHCEDRDRVEELLQAQRLDEARAMLDVMLARFAPFEAAGKRVTSFGSRTEYEEYSNTNADPESIVPVDVCYARIFQRQGFIAAEQHDHLTALELVDRAVSASPTMANAMVERGYVLSRLGRFQDAKGSYEAAIRLAERYTTSSDQLPLALRGLGYSLIELDQLDDAEAAFRRSLRVDPGNELALHELRYIESLRRSPR